jgi:signal peptide peptidase SppA
MNTPWAIMAEKLQVILDVLAYHAMGGTLTAEEIQERLANTPHAAASHSAPRAVGSIAVIPIYGVIAQRMDLMTQSSGGTSTETVMKAFRAAVADSTVRAIVFDVDSPGGTVNGVDELSTEIYRARGIKPVVAVANSMAASAAYWIASAADELVVTPSGEVGSIGVLAAHEDVSAAHETAGVRMTLITAGRYKAEGNPYEPLSEEARAAMQERVDEFYGMFTKAVARNRGVGVAAVREGYGEGRVVGARKALEAGMVDRIDTLDATIDRLAGAHRAAQRARAEAEYRQRRLRAAAR